MPEALAGATDYAAFLSYSQYDRPVCERVHRGLESLSRPFFRLRGRRVFRDADYLSAAVSLERVIRKALSQSNYFVLLASRNAARSFWVDFETRTWLDGHDGQPRNVLILLCEGDIVWNAAGGDFDWTRTTALPPAFKRKFESEPLFADLRGVIADGQPLTLRRTGFRDRLAEIVAPLDGRSKDEIVGRHLAVRRRIAVAATVVGLALALLAGALLNRSSELRRQRAVDAARQLLSRSADVVTAEGDPDHWAGALRAAVADAQGAVRELRSRLPALAQADEIYMRALLGGLPGRVTRIPLDRTAGGLVSDDGRRVAVAVDGGRTTVIWDLAAGREVARFPGTRVASRDLRAFAWSAGNGRIVMDVDGTRAVAAASTSVTLVPLATGRGGVLAYAERSASGDGLFLVEPGGPARPIARLPPGERVMGVGFDASGTRLALGTTRQVRLWALEDPPRLLARHEVAATDAGGDDASARDVGTAEGRIPVPVDDDTIACVDTASGQTRFRAVARPHAVDGGLVLPDPCATARVSRLVTGSAIQDAVVNETARRAVVLDAKGSTFVVDLRPASVDLADVIPGQARLTAIAERAPVQARATASRLWVWDVERATRLLDEPGAYAGARAALSPDGSTLAVTAGTTLTVWRCLRGGSCAAGRPLLLTATVAKDAAVSVTADSVLVLEPDGPSLLRITADALEPGVLPAGLRPVLLDTGPQGVSRVLLVDPAGTRLVGAELQGEVVANQAVLASGKPGDFSPALEYARLPGTDDVLILDGASGRVIRAGRGGAAGTQVRWTLNRRQPPLRAISGDGRFLAVATSVSGAVPEPIDGDVVEIVDLQGGRVVARLPLPAHVAAMRFGPGGHLAVAGNAVAAGDAGFRLRVYEPGAWQTVTDMQLPSRPEYVTFGLGDAVVAAGLRDGTTTVVNPAGVRVLGAPQRGRVVYCTFVDGGRRLASIGAEAAATTLQIAPASRAALADRLLELHAFVP